MQKTYYQILGVTAQSSADEIRAAHMKAVARLMNSGIPDPDSNALLDTALETLLDEGARASYDQMLAQSDAVPRIAARKAEVELMLDAEPRAERGPRWLTSVAMFVGAALVTVLVGWLLMKSVPSSAPPPIVVIKAPERSLTTEVPPTEEAAPARTNPDGSKAADPKPRTAEQVFTDVSASVVKVLVADEAGTPLAGGSGVVTSRGVVITNCHVVTKGPRVSVRAGKDVYSANVSLADEAYDLCQLNVAGLKAPAVEIGNMQYVRTGQKVFAIGAPQGLELTISEGIVSALRETPQGDVIQTTAPISPGSSGGGLFNVNGQLIGITTFQHKTGQNLNFAVPADWIAKMEPRAGKGPIPDGKE